MQQQKITISNKISQTALNSTLSISQNPNIAPMKIGIMTLPLCFLHLRQTTILNLHKSPSLTQPFTLWSQKFNVQILLIKSINLSLTSSNLKDVSTKSHSPKNSFEQLKHVDYPSSTKKLTPHTTLASPTHLIMEQNTLIYTAQTPPSIPTPISWSEIRLQNHERTFTMQVNQLEMNTLISNPRDLAQIVADGMQIGTHKFGRYHWLMMQAPYLEPYQPLNLPTPY